ncbi:MAG: hypothetical protein GXZ14_00920 [Ruminococcaceae bacterium]|nr:hypothetical protein [Oscillospiraceae bacterium]
MDNETKQKIHDFMELQKLPYEQKVRHAEGVAHSFYKTIRATGAQCHISVGGLDSITLHYFLESIGVYVPCISCSNLEDKSIQAVHEQIAGEMSKSCKYWDDDYYGAENPPQKPLFYFLKSEKSKVEVLNEFGFPVISKAKAKKISNLQVKDNPKQTFIHAIMTGDMGEQGKFQHSDKIKLPDKYIRLFGGNYAEHRPDLHCAVAPFKVSADCCYWLKEKPCDDWAKEHNSYPFLGLMASEGGQRELGLKKNGCNYYGKDVTRSAPFAIFERQDILQLALDLNVPIPQIYGEIKRDRFGKLYTTRAQRTGCSMCGFGIQMEKRPHRFDRLREDNPDEWEFYMRGCVNDKQTGEKYGWGRVLDYIGIGWADDPHGNLTGQFDMFGGEI